MIRRMTYVCSVAMAAVVAIGIWGSGAADLSAQERRGDGLDAVEKSVVSASPRYFGLVEPYYAEWGGVASSCGVFGNEAGLGSTPFNGCGSTANAVVPPIITNIISAEAGSQGKINIPDDAYIWLIR